MEYRELLTVALDFATAILLGALVGIEREKRKSEEDDTHIAGLRTFILLALFGAPHLDAILRGYDEAHPLRPGWMDRVPLHQMHPLATHSAGHGAGYAVALTHAARAVLRL